MRSRFWVAIAPVLAAASIAVAGPAFGKGAHGARRANPRTGKMAPALAELVKAHKRGDRAALSRVAERLGPARLAEALASPDAAVGTAALAAAPLARGGVLLSGAIAIQLGASDPARVVAAAAALGLLLDGAIPTALEEWDVPPDAVARACDGLRTLATRPDAPVAARLAALDAIAATMVSCGPADVSGLAHDPAPAIRRAAVLVAAAARREQVVVGAISDGDRGVSGAATASACRVEGRTPHTGRTQPPAPPALAAARTLAGAPGTAADDAVEMLDCLAAGGTPADRAQLDELQRRPPSPLRDRAVELAGARDSAQ